jgi:hypothetical protein
MSPDVEPAGEPTAIVDRLGRLADHEWHRPRDQRE